MKTLNREELIQVVGGRRFIQSHPDVVNRDRNPGRVPGVDANDFILDLSGLGNGKLGLAGQVDSTGYAFSA